MVSGIDLFDLLQLLSISKSNKVIEIDCVAGKGVIYIENGDIVHAQLDDVTGEDAVYTCLTDTVLNYRELPYASIDNRTVNSTTTFLLLEAARRKDERDLRIGKERNNEITPNDRVRGDVKRMEEILVSRIGQIKSVTGVILARPNGEVMAGIGDHINSLKTLTSRMVGVGGQLKELFRCDRMETIVVNTVDDKKILIANLKTAFLGVLINEEGMVDLIKADIIRILKG